MTHDQREQIAAAEATTPGGWSVWVDTTDDFDTLGWLRVADNLSGLDAHHLASKLNTVTAKVIKTDATGREIAEVLYSEMIFSEGDRVRLISVGREGEVVPRPWVSDTAPERYVTVHWDGNPPNHTASIPPENLEKIH
jgi:hypothetical protein